MSALMQNHYRDAYMDTKLAFYPDMKHVTDTANKLPNG